MRNPVLVAGLAAAAALIGGGPGTRGYEPIIQAPKSLDRPEWGKKRKGRWRQKGAAVCPQCRVTLSHGECVNRMCKTNGGYY